MSTTTIETPRVSATPLTDRLAARDTQRERVNRVRELVEQNADLRHYTAAALVWHRYLAYEAAVADEGAARTWSLLNLDRWAERLLEVGAATAVRDLVDALRDAA